MSGTLPPDDESRFGLIREQLFTAVVGDVLDRLGRRHQFLPAGIRPLQPQMRLVGRAMTVLEADVVEGAPGSTPSRGPLAGQPFGLMLEALDDLKPGEIYVAAGGSLRYAMWGGLMSTRARYLAAAGALVDGYVRDAGEIERMGFPVFCRGLYAQDQGPRGQVIDYRCPIEIGGVSIAPGDLLFGDREGVLAIPRDCENEAIAGALEKVTTEDKVAVAIRDGMSACDALRTFGVM
ncbi:MAG: RraA family protein [Burkholderiaceae bacterium]